MSRAHTDIGKIRNHLSAGAKRVGKRGGKVSHATKPTLADPSPFDFSLDELALIRALKNDDVMNNALNLPYIHKMYIEGMSTFRSLRREMSSLVSEAKPNEDGSMSIVFEGRNGAVAFLKGQEADEIIESLREFCEAGFKMVTNLFHDAQAALLVRLGKETLGSTWDVSRIP